MWGANMSDHGVHGWGGDFRIALSIVIEMPALLSAGLQSGDAPEIPAIVITFIRSGQHNMGAMELHVRFGVAICNLLSMAFDARLEHEKRIAYEAEFSRVLARASHGQEGHDSRRARDRRHGLGDSGDWPAEGDQRFRRSIFIVGDVSLAACCSGRMCHPQSTTAVAGIVLCGFQRKEYLSLSGAQLIPDLEWSIVGPMARHFNQASAGSF